MTRRALRLGLVLALAGGVANAADKPTALSTPAPAVTNAPSVQVIAYYFHGTVRCETCLKIERQAREAIERRFKSELAAKQLVFKPENYDLPDNAHFLQDYKLPCPSLVLVWQQDGKDQKWKLLGETWEHIENPVKFNEYVETEVDKFLREARKRGANGFSADFGGLGKNEEVRLTCIYRSRNMPALEFMKLVQIYRCLCDETRLRILHLLKQGPLCVCHFQDILQLPQVAVSKHLACLRRAGTVEARRHEQWMIYSLPASPGRELDLQLRCLQDCVQTEPVFRADLRRLKAAGSKCNWISHALKAPPVAKQASNPRRPSAPCAA